MKNTTIFNELRYLLVERCNIGEAVSTFINNRSSALSHWQLVDLLHETAYACDKLMNDSEQDCCIFLEYLASRFYLIGYDFYFDGLDYIYDDTNGCWYVYDDDGNIYLDIGEIPTDWYLAIEFIDDEE